MASARFVPASSSLSPTSLCLHRDGEGGEKGGRGGGEEEEGKKGNQERRGKERCLKKEKSSKEARLV